jgi:hypothetical protein
MLSPPLIQQTTPFELQLTKTLVEALAQSFSAGRAILRRHRAAGRDR